VHTQRSASAQVIARLDNTGTNSMATRPALGVGRPKRYDLT